MEIGLNIMPVAAPRLAEIGQQAEDLGFEGLYYGEHIIVPMHLKTPYPGKVGYNAKTIQLECYVALGHLAAVTKRVRLATGVTILPIRDPFQTARAISTIDNLSGGRFDLVYGVGSIPDEFEAMGIDYKTRGARLDEWLDIFEKLWTEDQPAFEGRFAHFEPVGFEPKPVQKPGPPIYAGAHSKVGLERAARRADGWYGAVYDAAQLGEIKAILEPELEKNGRDPKSFVYKLIHASGEAILPTPDELKAYEDAGAASVIVSPFELDRNDPDADLDAAASAVQDYLG
jgi:probable F420-dependent oxidoreductase